MIDAAHSTSANGLADTLIQIWEHQAQDGFLLSDPKTTSIATRQITDPRCGISYRFRWMPHREVRGNVAELERRGILNPRRDESGLFRDPRDPLSRHCFLCAENIRECHPAEQLVPLQLAGRDYYAGANFAWIEENHYTVMAAEHVDQVYSRHTLEAMIDLHRQTDRRFRVLFNGLGAGATIPWHLHYQITTTPLPIEEMPAGVEGYYPTAVQRFEGANGSIEQVHSEISAWLERDAEHHSINVLMAPARESSVIFIFPRDQRRSQATEKGLVGGFEVAGDFVLSAPHEEQTFQNASCEVSRNILSEIRPEI